jgi:hypothetical protein
MKNIRCLYLRLYKQISFIINKNKWTNFGGFNIDTQTLLSYNFKYVHYKSEFYSVLTDDLLVEGDQ